MSDSDVYTYKLHFIIPWGEYNDFTEIAPNTKIVPMYMYVPYDTFCEAVANLTATDNNNDYYY